VTVAPPDVDYDVEAPAINAGFFYAMQVPLLAGRSFPEDDDSAHPLVGIVNETSVKHYFISPAAAIGRRVAHGGGNHLQYMTIVGVTRDAKHTTLREATPPTLFNPLRQQKTVVSSICTTTPPEQSFAVVRFGCRSLYAGCRRFVDCGRRARSGDPACAPRLHS
jgi:putative ABC transport system permease protein